MRKNQAPSPSLSSALDKIRLHFTDSVPHIREFHNAPLDTDLRGSYRQSCAFAMMLMPWFIPAWVAAIFYVAFLMSIHLIVSNFHRFG